MSAHLTSSDVAAFRGKQLDRERIESIGAHVRGCEQCGQLLWSDPQIAKSVDAVWRSETTSRRPLFIAAAIAAGIAIVLLGIAIWRPRAEPTIVHVTPTPPSSRVVRDGNIDMTLDANGVVRNVSAPREEWSALVADALRNGAVPAVVPSLKGDASVLRGENETARVTLHAPLGVVLESDRPRFRWTGLPGARYQVLIAREGTMVMKSALQTAETWTPDAPLVRGAVYAWQLSVIIQDRERTVPPPAAPAARFRVLAESELRELNAARATNSRLLIGIVAARFRLYDLAARELAMFASEHREISAAKALADRYERPQ